VLAGGAPGAGRCAHPFRATGATDLLARPAARRSTHARTIREIEGRLRYFRHFNRSLFCSDIHQADLLLVQKSTRSISHVYRRWRNSSCSDYPPACLRALMANQFLTSGGDVVRDVLAGFDGALPSRVFTGEAGGGAVRVRLLGMQRVEAVGILPGAAEDVPMLEELIVVAMNDALERARAATQEVARGLLEHLGQE